MTPCKFQRSCVRKSNLYCEEDVMLSVEVNPSEPSVPSKLILYPTAIKSLYLSTGPGVAVESYKPPSYIALYLSSEVSYF